MASLVEGVLEMETGDHQFCFPDRDHHVMRNRVVSRALVPGFTLALGFLLGGIVSPPDAISATTIMRRVNVPKSLVSIAEGESLLNDASSLIVFRFAMAAVITGQFHFQEAATDLFLVMFIGIFVGLLVGMVFYVIHRWLPTTPSIEIVLTLVTLRNRLHTRATCPRFGAASSTDAGPAQSSPLRSAH
jgi:Sodium/hydrogen exchanger family